MDQSGVPPAKIASTIPQHPSTVRTRNTFGFNMLPRDTVNGLHEEEFVTMWRVVYTVYEIAGRYSIAVM